MSEEDQKRNEEQERQRQAAYLYSIIQSGKEIAAAFAVPGPVMAPPCAELSAADEHVYQLWLAGILPEEEMPDRILHAMEVRADPFGTYREPCRHPASPEAERHAVTSTPPS